MAYLQLQQTLHLLAEDKPDENFVKGEEGRLQQIDVKNRAIDEAIEKKSIKLKVKDRFPMIQGGCMTSRTPPAGSIITGGGCSPPASIAGLENEGEGLCKWGKCWTELKSAGMVQWSVRRQVKFVCDSVTNPRPPEISPEKTKCKKRRREHGGVVKEKVKKVVKSSKDRWSAERYRVAEDNMLEILKSRRAAMGSPILRPALRAEARKKIGDTGLLDHLLKHMAGRVAPGGKERFRRRHNADGAMEYWLESAELVNVRKEAGIQDPYWMPPAGWVPGDSPTQDPLCAKELKKLKSEVAQVKEEMQRITDYTKFKEETEVMTDEGRNNYLGDDGDSTILKYKSVYEELRRKKMKIEMQLLHLSHSLNLMQEEMGMLVEMKVEKKREKSGFRVCKPQGTFLWPNGSSNGKEKTHGVIHVRPPAAVSTSSTSSSAAAEATMVVRPLAERRAVHITLCTARGMPEFGDETTTATPEAVERRTVINLNEIPTPTGDDCSRIHVGVLGGF